MSRRFKPVVSGATALFVLLLLAALALNLYLRSAAPQRTGTVALPGLSAAVEIRRDSLDVPHIRAASAEDLFFAQGWVHAQDRLWQMELFRRVAQGRLAEILGPGLVDTDRFLRTIGLWRAAQAQQATVSPATMRLLQAYADGVNAWLTHHHGALPPEFLVLRFSPEPWTPLHSLAIEKVMAWDLSSWGISAAATRAARTLGEERARQLVPAYPEWGPTILDLPQVPEVPQTAAALLDAASITHASNAWVIGGARTRSGRPILANDMHLSLRAPSVWYLAALHGGGYDVAGMTLPGVPFVVAGHNRAIAWGYTNASLDDIDFFVERVDPEDSSRYMTPAGSEPFQVIQESIPVRGRDQPILFAVRVTRHGPILTDVTDPQSRGPLALRWAGLDPSHTIDAIPAFDLAGDWDDFLTAVRAFDDPHQNVVFADTAGDFGYAMGGRIPLRGNGRLPPLLPVPGWTGEWDWNGWVPFEQHPQVRNPPQGFVVTANNRQVAGEAADRISQYWEQPYRAARIRALILETDSIDAPAVQHMQLDVHDMRAERYRPLAATLARRAGLPAVARALIDWDLRASSDSHGAALFYAWYELLDRRLRAVIAGRAADISLPRSALNAMLDAAAVPGIDDGHAVFDSAALGAMRAADSLVADRNWGALHHVYAQHALDASHLLDRLLHLNVGGGPGDGSPTTVNVSDYPAGSMPVRAAYGPSERHVVDMANVDGAGGFILPTGESGLPFDAHYRDQWNPWHNGGLWRIPLEWSAAVARSVHTLTLQPAGK